MSVIFPRHFLKPHKRFYERTLCRFHSSSCNFSTFKNSQNENESNIPNTNSISTSSTSNSTSTSTSTNALTSILRSYSLTARRIKLNQPPNSTHFHRGEFCQYSSTTKTLRPNNKNFGGRLKKKQELSMVNENLIKQLLKNGQDVNSKMIRLVIENKNEEKSQIEIVALSDAIKTAAELSVDLVGISLDQNPPIVKAVDHKRLLYERSRSKANSPKTSGLKVTKEFQFRAGIADNDLQRKAANMISYLKLGHPCQVIISSNRRNLREDKDAVVTTLNRVKDLVGDLAKQQGALKANQFGSRGSLMLQPNVKNKK